MKIATNKPGVMGKLVLSLAVAGVGGLTLSGVLLSHPVPVRASEPAPATLTLTSQSAGPIAVTRGHTASFMMLLPAVQKLHDAHQVVYMRLLTASDGATLTQLTAPLDDLSHWSGALRVTINEDGGIVINGVHSKKFLNGDERLNLVGIANIRACDGSVIPTPAASIQVYNNETKITTSLIGLNFLPAVQRN